MREPKYRGKTKSGDWIYGAYVAFEGLQGAIYFPIRHSKDNCVIKTDWVYVNPESVGQSTGLHDVTGIEIYEGDIIKGIGNTLYKVVYLENCGAFTMATNNGPVPFNMYQNILKDFDYHVVGNTHDNPELMQ